MATASDEEIARSVQDRHVRVDIRVVWLTPAGRRRASPSYEADIRNEYLNESRSLKGKSAQEIEQKCRDQMAKWDEREVRGRIKDAHEKRISDEKAAAKELDKDAEARIKSIENLLDAALKKPVRLNWESFYERRIPSAFAEAPPPEPKLEAPTPPLPSWTEALLPWLKTLRAHENRRLQASFEDHRWEAQQRWHAETSNWQERLRQHRAKVAVDLEEQGRKNQSVDEFQWRVLQGEKAAIESYIALALEGRPYPAAFMVAHKIAFDPLGRIVTAELTLPAPARLSDVAGGKYAKGSATVAHMSSREHAALYDSAVRQAAMSTLHSVFSCIDTTVFDRVVVNGWVHHVDPATGQDVSSCILSVGAMRAEFSRLNLARIELVDCMTRLKALSGGSPSQLVPVTPLAR